MEEENIITETITIQRPNLSKLRKELSDYFSKNKIEGFTIEEFEIREGHHSGSYKIIPETPNLEESLDMKGEYPKQIQEIGEKYGISLSLIHWCYHK